MQHERPSLPKRSPHLVQPVDRQPPSAAAAGLTTTGSSVRNRTTTERPILPDMTVKLLRHGWAALRRGLIALKRITELTLCVGDDEQNAGLERLLGRGLVMF